MWFILSVTSAPSYVIHTLYTLAYTAHLSYCHSHCTPFALSFTLSAAHHALPPPVQQLLATDLTAKVHNISRRTSVLRAKSGGFVLVGGWWCGVLSLVLVRLLLLVLSLLLFIVLTLHPLAAQHDASQRHFARRHQWTLSAALGDDVAVVLRGWMVHVARAIAQVRLCVFPWWVVNRT